MSTASQPAKIACPHCQALIKAPALPPGAQVNCPKCNQPFRLGQAPDAPPARAPRGAAAAAPPRPPAAPVAAPRAAASAPDTAAAASSPAARASAPPPSPAAKDDALVDPNLLPPPPPKAKPKAQEVAVVCLVCGTRVYAPLDKVGKRIKCPDCHSLNEIKPPEPEAPARARGPTLQGAKEFALSEPVERPAYRPLVVPRGEYAVLRALDPVAAEQAAAEEAAAGGPSAHATPEDDMRLAPPVERVELKPEPIRLPVPDPEEELYDGRYDDGLIGDGVDRRQPDAWKKAPFVVGIIEFLFFLTTLPRWLGYAVGLVLIVNLIHGTIEAAASESLIGQGLSIPLMIASTLMVIFWAPQFLALLVAIIEDTANGLNEVENWPDWNFFEWLGNAVYVPAAIAVAGMPGVLLTGLLLATGLDPSTASLGGAAPLLLSWAVLVPIVLGSMLTEGTILAIFSPHIYRSLQHATGAWTLLYMYSVLGALLGAAAVGMMVGTSAVGRSIGAAGLVTLALLYARVLGRLLWYANGQLARLEEPAA